MRPRSVGGQLLLAGPSPAARRLIMRTGPGPLMQVLPGVAAAVRFPARDGHTWRGAGPVEEETTLFAACRNMPDDRVAQASQLGGAFAGAGLRPRQGVPGQGAEAGHRCAWTRVAAGRWAQGRRHTPLNQAVPSRRYPS